MTRSECTRCGEPIEFARTIPGQNLMPLDLTRYDDTDETANVALIPSHTGPYCRVITRDEPLRDGERRRMPHFATCTTTPNPPTQER